MSDGAQPAAGTLTCAFCGKSQREVRKLIAGPAVYICDECIGLCNDIIADEAKREGQAAPAGTGTGESVSSLLGDLDRKLREVEELRRRLAALTGV